MSKDIYDQFRAAEEALRAQAEASKQQRIREKEERARLAAEERIRIEEYDRQQQEIKARKIAEARIPLEPVRAALVNILTAIKDNDPRIQNEREKGVYLGEEIIDDKGTITIKDIVVLAWGNRLPSFPEENVKGAFIDGSGEAREGIDAHVGEDFSFLFIVADIGKTDINSGTKSTIQTNAIVDDYSVIMGSLALAISNPFRRFLAYRDVKGKYVYRGTIFRRLVHSPNYKPTDINGISRDSTFVSNGIRKFESDYFDAT